MKTRAFNATAAEVTLILGNETGQLWRPVKPQPSGRDGEALQRACLGHAVIFVDGGEKIRNPYGVPGDVLYVRETWDFDWRNMCVLYKADGGDSFDRAPYRKRWRSSATMPRLHSRIDIEVVAVQAKQVQEITAVDCAAGAIETYTNEHGRTLFGGNDGGELAWMPHDAAFAMRWDSLYAKRGLGWPLNPWAWVFDYRRIRPCPT